MKIVLKKLEGAVILAVALVAVLLVTSGMRARAGGLLEEEPGNKGIFVKGYMYGPPPEKALTTTYTVVKGDCLWNIAGKRRIYGDPTKWPNIYRANRRKIRNPNLIYPGQVLVIPH